MDLRGAKSNLMSASGTDWNCNCPFVAPGAWDNLDNAMKQSYAET
jgi:hypothetical protein